MPPGASLWSRTTVPSLFYFSVSGQGGVDSGCIPRMYPFDFNHKETMVKFVRGGLCSYPIAHRKVFALGRGV